MEKWKAEREARLARGEKEEEEEEEEEINIYAVAEEEVLTGWAVRVIWHLLHFALSCEDWAPRESAGVVRRKFAPSSSQDLSLLTWKTGMITSQYHRKVSRK